VLAFSPVLDERTSAAAVAARDAAPVTLKKILSPTVIGLTAFFATLNLSQSALQNFSGLALEKLYGIPLSIAAAGLTAYLVGTAGGVLVGGHVADTTKHHGKVAAMGYSFTALFTFVLATWYFGPYGIVVLLGAAGFAVGMILPSRDMLVREAAPPGGVARTFGIVTTGFNFGGTIGPLMYGWLLDHNMPRELLLLALGFMVLSIAMPLIGEWRNRHVVAGGAVAA
jgi:MFS family permease